MDCSVFRGQKLGSHLPNPNSARVIWIEQNTTKLHFLYTEISLQQVPRSYSTTNMNSPPLNLYPEQLAHR